MKRILMVVFGAALAVGCSSVSEQDIKVATTKALRGHGVRVWDGNEPTTCGNALPRQSPEYVSEMANTTWPPESAGIVGSVVADAVYPEATDAVVAGVRMKFLSVPASVEEVQCTTYGSGGFARTNCSPHSDLVAPTRLWAQVLVDSWKCPKQGR